MIQLRLSFAAVLIAWSLGVARAGDLRIVTVDAASGKSTPARVSVRPAGGEWLRGKDGKGKPIAAAGLPRIWSGGEVTVTLPAGKAEVVASRPFARLPASAEVSIPPEGAAEVKLELREVIDLGAMGWYGGDAHCHVVHGEKDYAVDLRIAAAISRAEGLDWCAFGEDWTSLEDRQPSPADLSRICRELTDGLFLAAWTMEHPKDHLGHMACFPLGSDRTFEEVCGSNLYTPTEGKREAFAHFEILRSLRGIGTISIYTHPTREYGGSPESPANIARELPFDAVAAPWALEGLDVLTDTPDNGANLRLWGFLLDRGHRLPACGFSDTCYDRAGERPGSTRTFVFLGSGPRTMPEIIAALRKGKTFATAGPLAIITVDGEPASIALPADGLPRQARIRAWNAVDYEDPRSPAFLTKLIVIRNGKPWKEFAAKEGAHEGEWAFEIAETETAWYAVQILGSSPRQFAVTSPVYFEGKGYRPPRAAEALVRGKVTDFRGEPLDGKVLAVEYGKGHLKTIAEGKVEKGAYEIRCPASSRIRIEAPGHEPGMKSLLLDLDPIYLDLLRPLRREKLWDPAFYAEIERLLGSAVLDFQLKAAN